MPHIDTPDGARIYYEALGEGRLLLFVHGGTGTGGYDWEAQLALADRFRLIIPDLRGHGRSTQPATPLSLDLIASDMLVLAGSLDRPLDAVVGFSIGASAMLRLLTQRPGLTRAFVAIGASFRGDPGRVEQIVTAPWPEELRRLRHEASEDREHWQELRRQLAETWAKTLDLGPPELARVDCPTLVVCGDRDRIEPIRTAALIARQVAQGELLVLPRAGHFAQRDRPGPFNAALVDFLDRVL